VRLAVFPECSLTGYTCGDLFHQSALIQSTEEALATVIDVTAKSFTGVAVVGLPMLADGMLFNTAAIVANGMLYGLVPKSHLPNYKEFYDARYFAPAKDFDIDCRIAGFDAVLGTQRIFDCGRFKLGVEICEDLWMPVAPSSMQALAGADVLVNLSASNETIGKSQYRRLLVANQSAKCLAAYVYCSSGFGESTSDLVFGGHAIIAENGTILAESGRFQRDAAMTVADIDLQHLAHDRMQTNSFHDARQDWPRETIGISLPVSSVLERRIEAHPFVPNDPATLRERCEEIFHIQTSALARRLELTGSPVVSIGVSGGLDSTLALLVLVKTLDSLKQPRENIRGLTMPGFGTTGRTKANAWKLMELLRIPGQEIDIRPLAFEQMKALKHKPFKIDLEKETVASLEDKLKNLAAENRSDLTFENTQARVRTSLLMNAGFVLGTGDLSELCLGWCTYNADHMSMFNVNASIPKTLVKFLVKWAAENEFDGDVRKVLLDIVGTEISPELLPTDAAGQSQSTEGTIGPYELHDFFLYHLLRWGSTPEKILFQARFAKFDREYAPEEIRRWLKLFLKRFFANQFKRNCLPDGPKVGSVSISPRGDWRMPSDAAARAWLAGL
jgi:NAD+ synthase (glutamine-hydrolysing)